MAVLDCRLQISAQGGCRGAGWSDGVLPQAEDSSSSYFLAPSRHQAAKSTSAPPGLVEKEKKGGVPVVRWPSSVRMCARCWCRQECWTWSDMQSSAVTGKVIPDLKLRIG